MLQVEGLEVAYGDLQVLWRVSFEVRRGEVVALLGSNGAGKTTTLNAISGVLPRRGGQVLFEGEPIGHLPPHRIVQRGLVQVPEGRRLFPSLSVLENLELGAYLPAHRRAIAEQLDRVFELFPVLRERRHQLAGSLSGGEQQMLAIARALMSRPKLLMLDEPTLGLAPIYVSRVFDIVARLRQAGVTVLVVEQNVRRSLQLADRAYIMENGSIVRTGRGPDLLRDPDLEKAYLGL